MTLRVRKKFLKFIGVERDGCETGTIGAEEKREQEAFETRCLRKTFIVNWREILTNEGVKIREL